MRRLFLISILFILACTKQEVPPPDVLPADEVSAPMDENSQDKPSDDSANDDRRFLKDHMDALKGAIIALDVEVTLKCLNRRLPSNRALRAHLKASNPNVKMNVLDRNSKDCSFKANFEGEGLATFSATLPLSGADRQAVGL
jgi:hypothetical protein